MEVNKTIFYFIISPLNYLNALEYRLRDTNNADRHVLYMMSDNIKKIEHISNMLKPSDWDAFEVLFKQDLGLRMVALPNFILGSYRRKGILKLIAKQIKNGDEVVLGNFNNIYCSFLDMKFTKNGIKTIYLDDGFGTLNIKDVIQSKSFGKLKTRALIEQVIFKQFNPPGNRIEIFSVFKISYPKIKVIKNDFKYLRNLITPDLVVENNIYFLGQPLAELNYFTNEEYNHRICKIKSYYEKKGLNFLYLNHSSERLENKPKSWNIISLSVPVEYDVILNNKIPKVYATFYSVAGFNLWSILNEKANYDFWIDDNLIQFPNIQTVYKTLKDLDCESFSFLNVADEQI